MVHNYLCCSGNRNMILVTLCFFFFLNLISSVLHQINLAFTVYTHKCHHTPDRDLWMYVKCCPCYLPETGSRSSCQVRLKKRVRVMVFSEVCHSHSLKIWCNHTSYFWRICLINFQLTTDTILYNVSNSCEFGLHRPKGRILHFTLNYYRNSKDVQYFG